MLTENGPLTINPDITELHRDRFLPAAPFPTLNATTDIVLPKWIYIKDNDGRYLHERSDPAYSTIDFRHGEPNLDCAFQAIQTSPSWYNLYAKSGKPINRYYNGWYSSDGNTTPSFNVISDSGNLVYLKDNYGPPLFLSNELKETGAPVGHNYINGSSLMEIVQAAIQHEITDVQYDINSAKVHEAAPTIALTTSICNYSDSSLTETLTYSYERWDVGTWNSIGGVEIGFRSYFSAGVPFVADTEFKLSFTGPYEHRWSGQEGESQTITSTSTVTVPPKKKAMATVIVRNAQIDIGFSYTQSVLWSNGESEKTTNSGVYHTVNSWHVDVQLDNWEDL